MSTNPHRKRKRFVIGVLCLFLCSLGSSARADESRQYKIEAAYLYNFFNYITWPGYDSPQALNQPVICVETNDPVEPYLEYVQHKIAQERTLIIRMLKDGESPKGCHILFTRHRIPTRVSDGDILTVFESDDPIDRGGMIELSQEDEVMSMIIDYSKLAEKGFNVSSRLLSLAQKVK